MIDLIFLPFELFFGLVGFVLLIAFWVVVIGICIDMISRFAHKAKEISGWPPESKETPK